MYFRNEFVFLNDFEVFTTRKLRTELIMKIFLRIYRSVLLLLLTMSAVGLVSCNDEVSYSDMKEKEGHAIENFIRSEGIKVITYKTFIENDSVTNCSDNEYVRVGDVYMQIVNNPKGKPAAKKLEKGKGLDLLVTYTEYNIMDAEEVSNNLSEVEPDAMNVKNIDGTYEAAFMSGVMMNLYSSTFVPTGWLTVMPYLYFVRNQSELAEVNLIVPHSSGTSIAATYVYPCFYNIKFQPAP